MSPRTITELVHRDAPLLRDDMPLADAVRAVAGSGLPALPVVDARGRLAGIFGEREFMEALFPGYLKQLSYAGFVPRSIESVLEKRASSSTEPVRDHMNTEHVDVPPDFADVQLAETFLHHRVLILPVTEDGRVVGVITRSDFFAALAERFLSSRT
ncbi:MAG TPA: CBS domain-containing protein [Solirubrobacteraceae bacterium]|nr:CBS domain-containing protein [Solirubrobacteraceae bacterium]